MAERFGSGTWGGELRVELLAKPEPCPAWSDGEDALLSQSPRESLGKVVHGGIGEVGEIECACRACGHSGGACHIGGVHHADAGFIACYVHE